MDLYYDDKKVRSIFIDRSNFLWISMTLYDLCEGTSIDLVISLIELWIDVSLIKNLDLSMTNRDLS